MASEHLQHDPPLWRDPLFWLTLALTIFAVAPFLLPGYFWGANDARHHVYFLFEYDRLVQDGIWWPRWSPDFAFGYGYPFFNIYGLFSHFLAELLHHFGGLGFTQAVEAIFSLSIVAGAGAMYAFVRSWLGRPAAMIAALAYTYAPYHLLNLYVRANLAESMAFVWLPLCLWTARQSVVRPAYKWVAGLAVSYAGLMLTSNLVVVLFTPLLAGYVLVLTVVEAGARGVGRGAWVRAWIKALIPPCLGGLAGSGIERSLLAAGFHRAPVCARRPVVRRALRLPRPLSSSCISSSARRGALASASPARTTRSAFRSARRSSPLRCWASCSRGGRRAGCAGRSATSSRARWPRSL
jgi:hypothetical protein